MIDMRKLNWEFIIKKPNPEFAPIISAEISTSIEFVALSLKPVIIEGSDEGRITFRNRSTPEAPKERADFMSRGSTLFTPLMVLSKMGHWAPQKITPILDVSPSPKKSMSTGNRASDGICLNVCTSPSENAANPLYQPIKNPRGIMVITAKLNPVRAR